MEIKKASFAEMTQLVLNIFLILSGLSVLFYLAGVSNYKTYYATLGISQIFLDFSYSEYVEKGFLSGMFIIVYLQLTILRYSSLNKAKQIKNEVSAALSENASSQSVKIKVNELKKKLEELEYMGIGSIDDSFWTKLIKILSVLFFASLVLILIAWLLNNISWIFDLLFFVSQILVTICFFYFIKQIEKTNYSFYLSAIISSVFIIIYIFVSPALEGYLEALSKLKTKDFHSYTVITEKRKIDYAKLVYYGKDKYFFFVNDKLNIIPQSEIELLEKN